MAPGMAYTQEPWKHRRATPTCAEPKAAANRRLHRQRGNAVNARTKRNCSTRSAHDCRDITSDRECTPTIKLSGAPR